MDLSSPSPSRRSPTKKHANSNRNLNHDPTATASAASPALLALHTPPPDHPPSRRSNSSSLQLNLSSSSSNNHTPPGTWSVSRKLVRKKASGLFREAARSWGRSKSKEVLAFGLGVLIGNQDSSSMNSSSSTLTPQPPTTQPQIQQPLSSSQPVQPHTPGNPLQAPPPPPPPPPTTGIITKGPKKRISFHGPKKLKGKSNENSKLLKRRSEIGFGDWADTLNTAVASSSPQTLPIDKSSDTLHCPAGTHQPDPPLNHSTSLTHLSQSSPDPMAIPLRRRDRSFNLTHNLHGPPQVDVEPLSSAPSSRVPRSTFPHAHRSPRSPRRLYNTRAAVQRNQSSLHPPPEPFFVLGTSTPPTHINGLTQYQQSAPLISSPFKRSVSPINQFEDDYDVESPIASKSFARAPPASDLQLRAARSARANLFGAMPNRSGGLEPTTASNSLSQSSTPQSAVQPAFHLPMWSNPPSAHPSNPTASLPRSRQRTVSATLQEHSIRLQDQYLTTLSENGCDSDPEVSKSGFGSPSSSPSQSQCQGFAPSHRSSSGVSHRTVPQHTRANQIERWVMPRIEGLDMTPRRPSLDGSCDDSDVDEKALQAGSSKSSSATSILSCLTTQELRSRITSGPSNCSLKTSLGAFDAFGALPPPESPFPGPPRFKRAGPAASPASPNKLKRDNDGELVGFASQPNLYRHRANAPVPTCSHPSLRLKYNPFEVTHPSHRDSWGQQSNCLSDEDEDGAGVVDQHDRDAINGSHESHEGTSNLSVPGLTDSSSLASSLASSNQSSNIRHPVDGAALLSTTWDRSSKETGRETKRRSLPTNVGRTPPHNLARVPPIPTGHAPTPLPSQHDRLALPATLFQSNDSSFQENESSFQSVKPNASAFLSSGMKSKKTLARSRREQGLDSTDAMLWYAKLKADDPNTSCTESNQSMSFEASIAAKSMCEALGGPRMILAARREDEARLRRKMSSGPSDGPSGSMHHATHANRSSDSPLGIVLPESFKNTSASSLKMPDTPIKKPFALPKSHPHINKPFVPSGLSKQSNAYSPSINGSPIDNSPSPRCHQSLVPESPIPLIEPKLKSSFPSKSPDSSSTSPYHSIYDDIDPSPSLNRSIVIGQIPSSLDSLSKRSSPFRRRSSDAVLSNHSSSVNLNKTCGSQQNHILDEAGTPTKVTNEWLKRAPQLLTSPSPGNSISSLNNSPSMHHHLQADHLTSRNSSFEHLVDPQVTPNRTTSVTPNLTTRVTPNRTSAQPYTPFLNTRMVAPDLKQVSPASTQHVPLSNRYESPTLQDNQHKNRDMCDSPLGGRFENQFDIVQLIGCGEFGKVYSVRSEGTLYAVKRARRQANGPKALGRQYEEVDALKRLTEASSRSPYIIQLFDSWEECNRWYIQTEFCENGTLALFLEMIAGLQDHVDEERIWKITSELAQAVAFMHSCGVLHLDIKPANIFITAYGGLKVGDFGLARRWPRINPNDVRECGLLSGQYKIYQHVPSSSSNNQDDDSLVPSRFLRYEDIEDPDERHMMRFKTRSGCFVGFDLEREGDREYIAPEILSGRYGEEADVFSVGLIALEISTNVILPDNGDEWRSLRSSDFSRTDLSHLSSELVLLIKRMMDKTPDRRITAEELVHHPVISKLSSLRAVGLANEEKKMMEDRAAFNDQPDTTEDTPMTPSDDGPIQPLRPAPPPDNFWTSARGAVLPEAEGFLPFILTGQSSPSRVKPFSHSSDMIISNDNYLKPQELSIAEVNDAMEIDV